MTETDQVDYITRYAKAAEIVTFLGQRGFLVDFAASTKTIVITPQPDAKIVARLAANEAELIEYFEWLGRPPATNHRFAPLANLGPETARFFGVCMKCGITWMKHGEPPETHWEPVTHLRAVRPRLCEAIWAAGEGRLPAFIKRGAAAFDALATASDAEIEALSVGPPDLSEATA